MEKVLYCSAVSLPALSSSLPEFQPGRVLSTMCEPEPASPCIGVCTMNLQTNLCDGCYRTLDEIAAWRSYTAEEKRAVLARLEERCLRIWDEALCI